MKLLDNDSIILSLEKAAEISLGIMGIIGMESDHDYYKGAEATYKSIIEAFKRQEEFVDAVPVVRCKDCVHRDPEDKKCDCGSLARQGCPFPVDDNYFCGYGERKDGEADE